MHPLAPLRTVLWVIWWIALPEFYFAEESEIPAMAV
jgi:hypothetical protein